MAVEFRLLGEVEARVDGRPVELGHLRQRSVLVALLVDAFGGVPADRLVERVWGPDYPLRARETLYSYLSRLRRILSSDAGVEMDRRVGGYALAVDAAAVDVSWFRSLVAQARNNDGDKALTLLERALELWRGEAFAGLDSPWLREVRDGLERERAAAELDRIDLALRCGRHAEFVADLHHRAMAHPLDERVAGQLMLALYRNGRVAESLDQYRRTRHILREEVGAEPGSALRVLHDRILNADPSLTRSPAPARGPVPRQLPTPPRLFTGRTRELSILDNRTKVDGAAVSVTAISGLGGIGKTWLALRWAHDHLDRFPDGQLYVNLRGFDPRGEPTPAAVAIRGFLDTFGVDARSIPDDPDAQVALYRSLIAGKRMLIVVDNARDTAQVLPLVPSTPPCTMLVTSRNSLTGLVTTHGAQHLSVDVLPAAEARDLLTRHVGRERLAAEPEAAADLLAFCAGLPLAIGIVAARAKSRPDFPLTLLADELRDDRDRLDGMDAGEAAASLRAVFSCSFTAQPPQAARTYQLLGLVTSPDIGVPAAASLIRQPVGRTRVLLRTLTDSHLLDEHVPGRYRMHHLVHLYAVDRAADLPRCEREAAARRLCDFYLRAAYHGDRLLHPRHEPATLDLPVTDVVPSPLPNSTSAWEWFGTEHANLLAAQQLAERHGWDTHVWQLAWALAVFHRRGGHTADAVTVARTGLAATQRLGDPAAQAFLHRQLGFAYVRSGNHNDGVNQVLQALTLFRHANDPHGEAATHLALAAARNLTGDHREALSQADHATRLFRDLDDPLGLGQSLHETGAAHARLGDLEQARHWSTQALMLARAHGHSETEADVLGSLGYIALHTGRLTEALDYCDDALTICRANHNAFESADHYARLGEAHAALGDTGRAHRAWHQAMRLYQSQHRMTEAQRVRSRLEGPSAERILEQMRR